MEYKYFKLMDDRKVIEYYRIWPNGTYQWWDEEKGVWHPGSHKTWEDKCFCVEKNALVVLEETSPLEMVVLLGSEVEGMFE